MNFIVEFLLFCVIICVIAIALRLKRVQQSEQKFKFNADSLKSQLVSLENQLNQSKKSQDLRESRFHESTADLRRILSREQESISKKEKELGEKELELTVRLQNLEKNLEEETESRKKVLSQKKSSEVRLGHIAETLAPFLDQFDFDPENCTFLGKPIDYISFDDDAVTLIEIKSGKSQLNSKQRHIRDLVKNNQVNWKEIRIQ
ncbi:MAG: hypothetical protein O3A15_00040 [Proteobacteria bacterium]|jgi:predicted Holliday junction resolvase-like endonuclease|nr:hypothetical protein [Pseudomonadota bacterium]